MSQCKIYLENYNGAYYAGSVIKGRVECYFDSETKVRGIKARIRCREYNEWTKSESYIDHNDGNKSKTRRVQYVGDRYVLNASRMLLGGDSGTHKIPPGRHVYPFSFTLPDDLPSTFNGPYGHISFWAEGVVDRPMAFDYEDKFIFVVHSPIDFNKKSLDLQDECNYTDEKTVCCWCCAGGNVTLDVMLPKTAFVVGETINFKVTITNLSNSSVSELKMKLFKRVTYRVNSPSTDDNSTTDEILKIKEHGVGAHGEHTYELSFKIPDNLEVPNFSQCHFFSAEYFMQFTAEFDGCTMDLDMEIWPELGHIQYDGDRDATPPPPVPPVPVPTSNIGFVSNDVPTYPPPLPTPYPPGPAVYPPPNPAYYPPPQAPTGYPEKPVYPGGYPTAPSGPHANAPPLDGPGDKLMQATGYVPTAPAQTPPEMPPPSYNQVQQSMNMNNAPYPPYPPQ